MEKTGSRIVAISIAALFVLFGLTPFVATNAQAATWSSQTTISYASSYQYVNCQFVFTDLYMYAMGHRTSSVNINNQLFRSPINDGKAWTLINQSLNAPDGRVAVTAYTVGNTDHVFLTPVSYYDRYGGMSTNNGTTWSPWFTEFIAHRDVALHTNSSWNTGAVPNGDMYYAYIDGADDLYVKTTHDNGTSWGSPVLVCANSLSVALVVSDSSIYVFYVNKTVNDDTTTWSRSDDWGATWTDGDAIYTKHASSEYCDVGSAQYLDEDKALLTLADRDTSMATSTMSVGYFWYSNDTYQPVYVNTPVLITTYGFNFVAGGIVHERDTPSSNYTMVYSVRADTASSSLKTRYSYDTGVSITFPYVDTPVIENPIGASTVYADVGFSWNATCTSPDNGTTDWTLDTNATFLSIAGGGDGEDYSVVSGTPDSGDVGSYYLNLSVSDGNSADYSNTTLAVLSQTPILSGSPAASVYVGDPYHFNATCSAPNDGATDWALDTNATFLSISDGGDGHDYCNVSGTATPAGTYYVNLSVSDDDSSDWVNYTLTAVAGNQSVLSAFGRDPADPCYLDTLLNFTVTYTDADGDMPLWMKWREDSGATQNVTMDEVDPGDSDTADGKDYYLETYLARGTHYYDYAAADVDGRPAAGTAR